MRILIAGVGSVLRGDDGFGVEVAHRLQRMELPPEVTVVEMGTGGIHLVQEMLADYDVLIVIDAVDRGRSPGTVMVIDPEIENVDEMAGLEKYDYLADMHYTKPGKALMLAKALKILPSTVVLVGCQPQDVELLERRLSEPVAAAAEKAVEEIKRIVTELLARERGGVSDG